MLHYFLFYRQKPSVCGGFTILELMIVSVIVGILASIVMPSYRQHIRKARLTGMVTTLSSFRKSFEFYRLQYGRFPRDSHVVLPQGMQGEISETVWRAETAIGGHYNWEGPNNYPYSGVSVLNATAPSAEIALLDRLIDDGDLSTGQFRLTPNGRHTYIFEETAQGGAVTPAANDGEDAR